MVSSTRAVALGPAQPVGDSGIRECALVRSPARSAILPSSVRAALQPARWQGGEHGSGSRAAFACSFRPTSAAPTRSASEARRTHAPVNHAELSQSVLERFTCDVEPASSGAQSSPVRATTDGCVDTAPRLRNDAQGVLAFAPRGCR